MTFKDTKTEQQKVNETESQTTLKTATDAIKASSVPIAGIGKTNSNLKDEGNLASEKIKRFKNDTDLKKQLTHFVMFFTAAWTIILNGIVIYNMKKFNAPLSDTILIALMTETLAIVIGLPTIVIWHFFPRQSDKDQEFTKTS